MTAPRARIRLVAATLALGTLALGARVRAANVNPAVIGAAAAAGAASASAPPPVERALSARPVPGWTDPQTGSPGRLGQGCDTASELLLSGSGRRTFLDLTLANESQRPLVFLPRETVARFSNGRLRRLLVASPGDAVLRPDWNIHLTFTFPDMTELEGQDWMEIQLHLVDADGASCRYATRLERDTSVPAARSTYVPHTSLEIQFSGGARFATAGALGAVAAPQGYAFDFGFAWYPWFRQGFLLDIVLDGYGTRGAPLIAPGLTLAQPRVTGSGLFLGYSVRAFPRSRVSLAYQPSVGIYAMELTDGPDGPAKVTSGLFVLRERVRLSWDAWEIADGTVFSFAASLVHLWLPYGTMGDARVTGNALSALLSFVVGG